MGYSSKICIDARRPKNDGTSKIFLRVIIDRKKTEIDLQISWPSVRFDSGKCKPRYKNDSDVNEYNVIIQDACAKANAIHKKYLLRSGHLNLDLFMKDYNSNLDKDDFIKYFYQKSFARWNKSKITDHTF